MKQDIYYIEGKEAFNTEERCCNCQRQFAKHILVLKLCPDCFREILHDESPSFVEYQQGISYKSCCGEY